MSKKVYVPTRIDISHVWGKCTAKEYIIYLKNSIEIVFEKESNRWYVYADRCSANPYEIEYFEIYPEWIEQIKILIQLLTE